MSPHPVLRSIHFIPRTPKVPVTFLCSHCGSKDFQASSLRLSDVSRLLRFQLPVRCRSCMKRRYVPFSFASQLPWPSRKRRRKSTA